jgi:sortase A
LWAGAELAVTVGLVLLLLVVHQLWWTNRQAREGARREVRALERAWDRAAPAPKPAEDGEGATPGEESPEPADSGAVGRDGAGAPSGGGTGGRSDSRGDRAYAILRIPRLGVVAPVARGVSKQGVLDKGDVGHYPGTAQPGRAGNVALAGHRNTHGEPFRYINRLRSGDAVVITTRDAVFTYTVDKALARTSAQDGGVIAAVPRSAVKPAYGYDEPGHYLTLTTCTPEYTSRYRLVVWGKLTATRPR